MGQAVIAPRIRGFICTTSHPAGCARNVDSQIAVAARSAAAAPDRYRALVIGASQGYGLAARIAAAELYNADTVGVFFERPGQDTKTGTSGYYNTAAFHRRAQEKGRLSVNINGDAFSDEIKNETIQTVKASMGQADLVVYSLAAPRRTDPRTGEVYKSDIGPVGEPYTGKTIDLTKEIVTEVTLPPATEEAIRGTVGVMGGGDVRLWADALLAADALADGARLVSFSYLGPELTWPIYRSGTIGKAKEDMERAIAEIGDALRSRIGGAAYVSVNKAVVTQASSAIPVVPLYLGILYRIMKERGVHEAPIHQMVRLLTRHIGPGRSPKLDDRGRIRLDDRELDPAIQAEILRLWDVIDTDNFRALSNYDGFKREFRQLFGFEVDGVDYEEPVEVEAEI